MRNWGTGVRVEWILRGEHQIGGIRLSGLPKGVAIDPQRLIRQVERRSPGKVPWTASRKEPEDFAVASGLLDGVTTGETLEIVRTGEGKSPQIRTIPRPGTQDVTAFERYGAQTDAGEDGFYGAGAMLLMTAAGAAAQEVLRSRGIQIGAHIASVGLLRDHLFDPMGIDTDALEALREKSFPVLDDARGMQMMQRILREKAAGNSVGGQIEACVTGLPKGLGGAWFSNLQGTVAQALYAIPGVKGVEFGSGFAAAALTGSQNNDPIAASDGGIGMSANRSGGILGGISTGLPLIVRAAFKPTPTIAVEQETADPATGERVVLIGRVEDENRPRGRHEKPLEPVPEKQTSPRGRHESAAEDHVAEPTDEFFDIRTGQTVRIHELGDAMEPCIVPRAVPLVEGMLALAILDVVLQQEQR